MAAQKAYIADRIFTGKDWLDNHALIVEDKRISEILPVSSLSSTQKVEQFNGCIITPAFIDLQIYGAFGRLLAVYPEVDSLYKLNEYCNKGGAAFCLPTVATNTKEVVYKCIDAVRDYWKNEGEGLPAGRQGVLGLHLEGPWINPVKRGAHIESFIHPPSLKEAGEILNYGNGIIKMITLAPEICSKEVIDLILSHNIIISAGHSNATYPEANRGFANGISAVTHLYNAMSPLSHRAPGLTGAAMDHATVMAGIIPDGYHVDFAAVRIAKQVMKERLFVITDAVTETNEGYYQHQLAGDKYEAGGILSGSSLTMSKALQNLVNHTGIELGEALRMCSLYPARVIKRESTLGMISKGYPANIVVLNQALETVALLHS